MPPILLIAPSPKFSDLPLALYYVETMDSLCCWTFRVNGLCSHTNGRRWPAGGAMQFVAFSQHQLSQAASMAYFHGCRLPE